MKEKGVKFQHCGEAMLIEYLALYPNGNIYLIGRCSVCSEYVKNNLATAIAGLYEQAVQKVVES